MLLLDIWQLSQESRLHWQYLCQQTGFTHALVQWSTLRNEHILVVHWAGTTAELPFQAMAMNKDVPIYVISEGQVCPSSF